MRELFLRFDDQEQAMAVLSTVGIEMQDGCWPVTGEATGAIAYALDPVFGTGTIWHETGELVAGEPAPAPLMVKVPGYHMNLAIYHEHVPPALADYLIQPASPALVWA